MCKASGAGRKYAYIKSGLCRCISVSCVSNCLEYGPASVLGAIADAMLRWPAIWQCVCRTAAGRPQDAAGKAHSAVTTSTVK